MSPVRQATSSARPEELHRYRAEVVRLHARTVRSLREAEQAAAAYGAACPDVPVTAPPVGATHDVIGLLRGLATRVGDVGEAFLLADRSPTHGVARVADDDIARVIVRRFPTLANAAVLGPLADELAEQVADELAAMALDGRWDLADLRATVPAALAHDPTFARAVLRRLGPDRLSVLADRLALEAPAARPTVDLRWLGDLFAIGAASSRGDPTAATRALLDSADGRTAVRILRASSSIRLPGPAVEAIALATAVHHSSRADGGHPFLVDRRSLDTGDDQILLEAARVPGLALRLLTGDDHEHPALGRLEHLLAAGSGASARGVAALLEAGRGDPRRHDAGGGLSPAGLVLLHGTVAALAGRPRAGLATDAPSTPLVAAATAVIADDVELAVAHTRAPDEADERRRRVDELVRALEHAAHVEGTWSRVVDRLHAGRAEAVRTSIATGDDTALQLAGRLEAILTDAAGQADAPDRRLDPVLDRVADVAGAYVARSYGPMGGTAASAGIHAAADRAADELAGDPGSAGERLRMRRAETERVLAVVEAMPGEVEWAGSGVSGRAELMAAAETELGEQVLEQWELVQGPEVHRELARLRAVYAAGIDLSR